MRRESKYRIITDVDPSTGRVIHRRSDGKTMTDLDGDAAMKQFRNRQGGTPAQKEAAVRIATGTGR